MCADLCMCVYVKYLCVSVCVSNKKEYTQLPYLQCLI